MSTRLEQGESRLTLIPYSFSGHRAMSRNQMKERTAVETMANPQTHTGSGQRKEQEAESFDFA